MQFLTQIQNGIYIDEPKLHLPWDTSEYLLIMKCIDFAHYSHDRITHKLKKIKLSDIFFDLSITYWRQDQTIDRFMLQNRYINNYEEEFLDHIKMIQNILGPGKKSSTAWESVKQFPIYTWDLGEIIIQQRTFEHFGLIEKIEISKKTYFEGTTDYHGEYLRKIDYFKL